MNYSIEVKPSDRGNDIYISITIKDLSVNNIGQLASIKKDAEDSYYRYLRLMGFKNPGGTQSSDNQ